MLQIKDIAVTTFNPQLCKVTDKSLRALPDTTLFGDYVDETHQIIKKIKLVLGVVFIANVRQCESKKGNKFGVLTVKGQGHKPCECVILPNAWKEIWDFCTPGKLVYLDGVAELDQASNEMQLKIGHFDIAQQIHRKEGSPKNEKSKTYGIQPLTALTKTEKNFIANKYGKTVKEITYNDFLAIDDDEDDDYVIEDSTPDIDSFEL